ncbi:CocE/NonD family hydrolase [Mesonia aestuariivivens]|uniref:CocE/NonD family hydrolase n=1 Tax=Mesonia aestuariivivens TaxID=2796128 RepID=A0ABS6W3N8_9FLAO|nr:CocE/NonD family hydrolase [Mesonia aestuariivivens]MBW2962480.1 CocE/NonD family hydrolase [Mesonia aestuariivivens]
MNIHLKNLILLIITFFSLQIVAQSDYKVKEHYTKQAVDIEMRDGIKLHTTIYSPKDTSKKYPILMQRTPYSSKPYGKEEFRSKIGPNQFLMKEGNIIVYQDVRGRWMSEGDYDNMRPYIPNKKGKEIDEASDTYDTIEWLINNVENNNGNVGTWGISYPGFYTSYSLLSGHPALKAASPQASISDFFFDDFHHNGAYLLSYFMATALFGNQTQAPTTESWYTFPKLPSKDQYQFFLDHTPINQLDEYYLDNFFWDQLSDHPSYDKFWQDRGLIQHLKETNIKTAVMYVGGFFDAEDLYGPFQSYKAIEENSNNYNTIVYGPWSHGDWAGSKKRQAVGNVYFGDDISENYQRDVETKFFNYFLKEEGKPKNSPLSEAMMFDTGSHEWTSFEAWPPKAVKKKTYYLGDHQQLKSLPNKAYENKFISDPQKPVPYSEDIKIVFTPRKYMTDDQRFAARRPDVLVYETEVLENDMTMAGEIEAKLNVATTGTDADWVVKVIDVYPADAQDTEEVQDHLKMSNYHMMVRSEVLPARFRNSFEKAEASIPNQKTAIDFTLQGIYHTFKKGHKIQIQVQSTWFPLINLNPQTFVPNIFEAEKTDYKKQTHTVYGDSSIEFMMLEK